MLPADIYWGLIGKSQLTLALYGLRATQVICVQLSLNSSNLPEPLNFSTHDFYRDLLTLPGYRCVRYGHIYR